MAVYLTGEMVSLLAEFPTQDDSVIPGGFSLLPLCCFKIVTKHPAELAVFMCAIQEHAKSVMFLLYQHAFHPPNPCKSWVVVAHIYNPNTREAELGRPLELTSHPGYPHHQALGPSTEPASKNKVAVS